MSTEPETREELPVIDAQIVRYQPKGESLAIVREPKDVLADAQKVAAALMEVVKAKKKPITFNGETYLESGDWQMVAAFHGVTTKVEWTRFVEFGEIKGFEAAVIAIDRFGREVGRGEAMCLNDEENWGMRPRYEWQDVLDANGNKIWEPNPNKPGKNRPKSKRVKIGEEATPLFQLRSMAQTRACGKALSNIFKWVVVLAGYKPTPAEEMIGKTDEARNTSENISQPPVSPQTKTEAQPPTGKPADSPAAPQSRVGPTKRIPPTRPDKLPRLICTVKVIKEWPKDGKVNACINVKFDAALDGNNQGETWVCAQAACWHESLFEAIRASVGKECQFAIKERDAKSVHYIDIEDVIEIAGVPYDLGKPSVDFETGEIIEGDAK